VQTPLARFVVDLQVVLVRQLDHQAIGGDPKDLYLARALMLMYSQLTSILHWGTVEEEEEKKEEKQEQEQQEVVEKIRNNKSTTNRTSGD